MKNLFRLFNALFLALVFAYPTYIHSTEKIIITSFEKSKDIPLGDVDTIREFIITDLLSKYNSQYTVIKIPPTKPCNSLECAMEEANRVGSDLVLTASVLKLGSKYFLVGNLVDIRQKKIVRSEKLQSNSIEEFATMTSTFLQSMFLSKPKVEDTLSPKANVELLAIKIHSNIEGGEIWLNAKNTGLKTPSTIQINPINSNTIKVVNGEEFKTYKLKAEESPAELSFQFSTNSSKVKWEDKNELVEQETNSVLDRFGFSIFSPISYNDDGNPRYFQTNLLYGTFKDLYGLNLSTGINSTQEGRLEDGSVRYSELKGAQIGLVNHSGKVKGFQLSVYNSSDYATGFQLGIVGNYNNENFKGAQIGLGLTLVSLNKNGGDLEGFQFGTILNVNGGNIKGMQMSGLANINQESNKALQLSILGANLNSGEHYGTQISGLLNRNEKEFRGQAQLALFLNTVSKDSSGIQIAAINQVVGTMESLQLGGVNISGVSLGLQFGGYNYSKGNANYQVGLVNYSTKKAKLQIGLLNIAKENRFPVLPFVNWDF